MSNADYEAVQVATHSEEAEKALLGIVLAYPVHLLDIRRNLGWEDFYKPAHQAIYKTILSLDDAQIPIEPRTVLLELNRTEEIKKVPTGATYLTDLFGDAGSPTSFSHYSKVIRDFATMRSIDLLATMMKQQAKEGSATPASLLEAARTNLDSITVDRLGSELPMISDVLPLTLEEIHTLQDSGAVIGVPTGFVDLDKALNGLQAGQMIVIAARPGVGKALALDTKLPTPTGWTTMEAVKVGDSLIDREGEITKVVGVTDVMLNRPCYRLSFSDGTVITADENHIWFVEISTQAGTAVYAESTEDRTFLVEFDGVFESIISTQNIFEYHNKSLVQKIRKVKPSDLSLQINQGAVVSKMSPHIFINSIEKVESVPVKCIEVDSKDNSYLASHGLIPTHNSSLAMDIARNAAFRQDKSVIVFSLEMSSPELVMRMLSAESHVDLQYLKTGTMNDEMWQKLAEAASTMQDKKLSLDDTATVTLPEIRAKARAIQRIHGLDLIVIDYIQLMNNDGRSDSRQQEVSEISRGIKLLAKEFKVPVIALSQLNRGSEQRQDKRPVISDLRESGCMTGDTQLLRADNGSLITFDELMANGFENVMVWSIDDKRKMVSGKITNVFASGIMETYLLKLASGKEVKASGNHKFFTFGGWKPLEELEIGEKLAIPRTIPINSESKGLGWNEYRLGLLGHLLGDGCVLKGAPLHYTNGDEANLSFVEEAALSEFCITPRRDKPGIGNWENVYLPSPHPTGHGLKNPIQIWFDDMNIADLRSYEKRIPTILFQANKLETAVFLKHLFATDGGVWHGGKAGAYKIHYSSSSRELIDGVALLISRFGIVGRIKKVKYKNSLRPGYQLSISNIPDILTFANEIGIHGLRGEQLKSLVAQIGNTKTKTWIDTLPVEIWHLIESERKLKGISRKIMMSDMGISSLGSSLYKSGISRERLERVANSLDSNLLREYIQDDIFWDKVVAIEPLGPIEVYDATVEENHNFIANGIVAKNSIEQDADVVILLHREEMYEKESPRAGEADVIIAKQRSGPTSTVVLSWLGKFVKFSNAYID